jgi:thiol-disulfide isomerase/thioredoxin
VTQLTGDLPVEGRLPSLAGATGWLNSEPLAASDLLGKVVLFDIWTYSCINWLRTFPYIRAWAEKYRDQGLVVIGVHTPEFSFEQDVDNVRAFVKARAIDYPVAMDNDYAVWDAFANRYWPALYFVDARGNLRHHHFGEGRYEESERAIQLLLEETGVRTVSEQLVSVAGSGDEAEADWNELQTPETYVGHGRALNFASPGGVVPDERSAYAAPAHLSLNQWALSGDWTMGSEAASLHEPGGGIAFRFHARDLHLVMGPAGRGAPVRFRVLIDGQPPGASHGVDVDDQGEGTVAEPRMYQLVRQAGGVTGRTFEITFLDAGLQGYVFTFG